MAKLPTEWIKSSFSGGHGACVEIRCRGRWVDIRHSSQGAHGERAPMLAVEFDEWLEFLDSGQARPVRASQIESVGLSIDQGRLTATVTPQGLGSKAWGTKASEGASEQASGGASDERPLELEFTAREWEAFTMGAARGELRGR